MFYWKFSHFIFRENFAFFRGETDKIEIRRKKLFAKLSTLFAGNPTQKCPNQAFCATGCAMVWIKALPWCSEHISHFCNKVTEVTRLLFFVVLGQQHKGVLYHLCGEGTYHSWAYPARTSQSPALTSRPGVRRWSLHQAIFFNKF